MRFVLVALLAVALPRPADSCSISVPSPHQKDPQHATDVTPPSATFVTTSRVESSDGGGCCGGARRWIELGLVASDDKTSADELGYKLTVVGGEPPRNFPETQTLQYGGDRMPVSVDFEDAAFAFDLEIRAVDLNGNEGPPVVVEIAFQAESSGCSTSSELPVWAMFVIGALALAIRRRRR